MRKEVLIAIILGLILGSVLVYGIYSANKAASKITPQNQNNNSTTTPTEPETKEILTLTSPQDGDVFASSTATISGQTDPQNALAIITENDQLLPKISDTGKFTATIELVKGGNLIQVTAITPSGQRQDLYLNLVFTSDSQ